MKFEHSLAPSTLWCNATDCTTRFGVSVDLHSIECSERRCVVQLHCHGKIMLLAKTALVTLITLAILIGALVCSLGTSTQLHDTEKRL